MAKYRAVINTSASDDGGYTWHIAIELHEKVKRLSGDRWRIVESRFIGWNRVNKSLVRRYLKMWGLKKGDLIR